MVRLIDRYILREFGPFFVIALGVTTFILFLDKLLGLSSFMLRNHLDAWTCLRFLGYLLPTVGGLALPIALLIGSILTFNRLSTDSEYIVLKAAGISFYRLLLPLLVAASVVYVASSFALMYGSPWGLQGIRRLIFEVARSQAYYYLRPREFNNTFAGLVLYVERLHPAGRQSSGFARLGAQALRENAANPGVAGRCHLPAESRSRGAAGARCATGPDARWRVRGRARPTWPSSRWP